MNDGLGLVERLRAVADELHKLDATMVDAPQGRSLYREAADEIERLNAWAVAFYKETRGAILAERERCAQICDQLDAMSRDPMVCRGSAQECAEAIRNGIDCGEAGHAEGRCGNEPCLRGPNVRGEAGQTAAPTLDSN